MNENEAKIPIGRIKDEDEKKKHEDILELLLEENVAFSRLENSQKDMLEKVSRDLDGIPTTDRSNEEERLVYRNNVKSSLLRNNEYESRLKDNIRAEIFMLNEYELRKKYPSAGKMLMGLAKGEEDAKKLLGFIVLRETGRITMPKRMNVNYQILPELLEQYDSSFVDIDKEQIKKELEEQNSVALVPYNDNSIFKFAEVASNGLFLEVDDMIKEAINNNSKERIEKYVVKKDSNTDNKTKPKSINMSPAKEEREKE